MAETVKRPMGRPPKGAPEPIPDTIENIIQVVVKTRKDRTEGLGTRK